VGRLFLMNRTAVRVKIIDKGWKVKKKKSWKLGSSVTEERKSELKIIDLGGGGRHTNE